MKLDLDVLEGFIIFAYHSSRFTLVEELLPLIHMFESGESYVITKNACEQRREPQLRLVPTGAQSE